VVRVGRDAADDDDDDVVVVVSWKPDDGI